MARMSGLSMQFVPVCSVTGTALIPEDIDPVPEIEDGYKYFLCKCHMQRIKYRPAGPMERDEGND